MRTQHGDHTPTTTQAALHRSRNTTATRPDAIEQSHGSTDRGSTDVGEWTTSAIELAALHHRLITLIDGTGPGIVLQPVIHIQSGARVGAEALARFPGPMTTAEWFQTAHALGVGDDLELRIVHEVAQQIDRWTSGFIGVNVSPSILLDPRLIEILRAVNGPEVVLEITDQTARPKLSVLRARLDEVRGLGIRVAIHVSEFGRSTTRFLTVVRPDVVKLDPPATAALVAGHVDATAASELFRFCRREGVFVVAVGVQTRRQLEVLVDLGVDASQGSFAPVERG